MTANGKSLIYGSQRVRSLLGETVLTSLRETAEGFRCSMCNQVGDARAARTNIVIQSGADGFSTSHLVHVSCGRSQVILTDGHPEVHLHPDDDQMYVVMWFSWEPEGQGDLRAGLILDVTSALLVSESPSMPFTNLSVVGLVDNGWQPVPILNGDYAPNPLCKVILRRDGTGLIESVDGVIAPELPDLNDMWLDLAHARRSIDVVAGPFGLRSLSQESRDARINHVADQGLAVATQLQLAVC